VDDHVGHPVQQAHVLDEPGEDARENRRQDGESAQGAQQRNEGGPGDSPVPEFREGQHEEDPRKGGQSGGDRGKSRGPCGAESRARVR